MNLRRNTLSLVAAVTLAGLGASSVESAERETPLPAVKAEISAWLTELLGRQG